MLRAVSIPCRLPRAEADVLNRASGEVYSRVVVTHWRVYRRTGHWLRAVASLQSKLSRTKRGSRRSKRLHHAKRRMLARQKRRQRDLLHKVSRATIAWCQERNVGTLAIGDIRGIADRTKEERRLHRNVRQKMSSWSHGTLRQYLGYKAEEAGIGVHDNVPEHHTSQTCPEVRPSAQAEGSHLPLHGTGLRLRVRQGWRRGREHPVPFPARGTGQGVPIRNQVSSPSLAGQA